MGGFILSVLTSFVMLFSGISVDTIKSITQADKESAYEHVLVQQNTTRKNASGAKITSNAHSKDYPGVYFIWDAKQKDSGYLKVDQKVFGVYDAFVLTTKESNTYWDFLIAIYEGQEAVAEGNNSYYTYFIPRAMNNKNINMVFIDTAAPKSEEVVTPIQFELEVYHIVRATGEVRYFDGNNKNEYILGQGEYFYSAEVNGVVYVYDVNGVELTWLNENNQEEFTIFTLFGAATRANLPAGHEFLNEISCIDVTWAGSLDVLVNDVNSLTTTATVIPLESGRYVLVFWYGENDTEEQIEYLRYRAYVQLWNDLYLSLGANSDEGRILYREGGIEHYNALLVAYGATSLPPYFAFEDYNFGENTWADKLEVGLLQVYEGSLAQWVIDFGQVA